MEKLFTRRSVKKDSISAFDFENTSDILASGLEKVETSTLIKRNESFFKSLRELADGEIDGNPVARVTSLLEEKFNSREIAFLLAKSMLTEAMQKEEVKKRKVPTEGTEMQE